VDVKTTSFVNWWGMGQSVISISYCICRELTQHVELKREVIAEYFAAEVIFDEGTCREYIRFLDVSAPSNRRGGAA